MEANSLKLSALLKEFCKWSVACEATKRKCAFSIAKLIKFVGNIPVGELTTAMCSRFQAYMKSADLSDGSVGSYFSACSQVFSWSKSQGLIKVNPFAKAQKVRRGTIEIRTYKPEEIQALLQVSPLRWTATFLCGLHGLRIGEILNLRWSDIDLDAGVLHIQYRPDKKDEHWQWGTKGKADRTVPMSQALWDCLCRLQVIAPWTYPFLKEQRCRRLQSLIGQLPEHIRKLPYNNFYRELGRIRRAAKIRSGGVHQLRKNAATHLAQQGLPLHETKTLLGHQSIDTTLRHYIAVDRQRCLQNGRNAFDNYQLGPVGFEPTTNGL